MNRDDQSFLRVDTHSNFLSFIFYNVKWLTIQSPIEVEIPLMHASQTGLNASKMSIRCNVEKYVGQSVMPSTK